MKKAILFVILILIVTSCIPQKLGSTGTDKLLGILLGTKPSDSAYTLSEEPTSIDEGTKKEIKFHLAKIPETDAVITITSDTPYLEVNGSNSLTLTFTPENYSSDQTFTIAALIDDNAEDETGNIKISADYGYVSKTLKITHKEAQGDWISITPDTVYLTNIASDIKVKLNTKPVEDISITILSNISTGVVGKETLTFTTENYNIEQIAFTVNKKILNNINLYHVDDYSNFLVTASTQSISVGKKIYVNQVKTFATVNPVFHYDGTFTDKANQLIWNYCPHKLSGVNCASGKISYLFWKDAISYCHSLTLKGYNWRLATYEELMYSMYPYLKAIGYNVVIDLGVEIFTSTTSDNDPFSVKLYNSSSGAINFIKDNASTFFCVADTEDEQVLATTSPGLKLSEEPSIINEGSSKTIEISLFTKPESDTVVTITSDNDAIKVNPTTLTFTPNNYYYQKEITFSALMDANTVNETANIMISTNNGYANETFSITNQDTGKDIISIYSNTISLKELPANIYIKSNIKPETLMLMVLSSGQSQGIENKGPLTFLPSNYGTYQAAFTVNKKVLNNTNIYQDNDRPYLSISVVVSDTSSSVTINKNIYVNDEQTFLTPNITYSGSIDGHDSNRIIRDSANNLEWFFSCPIYNNNQPCVEPTVQYIPWKDALNVCNSQNTRLPTYQELTQHLLYLDTLNLLLNNVKVWSSTTDLDNTGNIKGFLPPTGIVSHPKTEKGIFYCVRDL
ncbi:MAG: DUF1566 domain-containing protein [Leptospiraceae bacterium]|nr:DUF1566 domain-containing protein [Leptospiraceae bacterium]